MIEESLVIGALLDFFLLVVYVLRGAKTKAGKGFPLETPFPASCPKENTIRRDYGGYYPPRKNTSERDQLFA